MDDNRNMTRREAIKTMGGIVATAALASTGMSLFAAPVKKVKAKKRIVFYFTATGNCLFAARRLAGEHGKVLSIPQLLKSKHLKYKADEVGFVFPDFAAMAPLMVREFVQKVHIEARYVFSVITYGNFAANVAEWWDGFCKENGLTNNYVNTLLMVDNYLPVFDMNEQVKREKHVSENLSAILNDINGHRQFVSQFSQMDDRMKGFLSRLQKEHFPMEAERLLKLKQDACIGCGTCASVCPHGNFVVTGKTVEFTGSCEYCLACVHACPQKALTLIRGERNPQARFRNENVSLMDIKLSNNQLK